jgi:hypothetical protein
MTRWTDKTDDELAEDAQTGLRGQGAIVEALRRHRSTLEKLDRSSSRLACVGLVVAIVGIVVAILQLWAAL